MQDVQDFRVHACFGSEMAAILTAQHSTEMAVVNGRFKTVPVFDIPRAAKLECVSVGVRHLLVSSYFIYEENLSHVRPL